MGHMDHLLLAAAQGQPASRWTGLIVLAGGLLFATLGWFMVRAKPWFLDWWLGKAGEEQQVPLVLRPVRRANIALFGSAQRHEEFKRDTMPKIVGTVFLLLGSIATVAGVARLIAGKS